jgi:hypothetical protein
VVRVAALYTYPVKGGHRLEPQEAAVEHYGLAGDRRWLVVDADGVGVTQRRNAGLVHLRARPRPGGLVLVAPGRPELDVPEPADGPTAVRVFAGQPPVPARLAGPQADRWLTDLLGEPVRLTWLADTGVRPVDPAWAAPDDRVGFADAFQLLLANAASLDAVNDWLLAEGDEPVPMTRFRPNVVLAGAPPWAEDGWIGRRLRIGDVTVRVVKPCDRCVVTTIDQETGEKGRQPLRALGRHRRDPLGLLFAVNAVPDGTGLIRVGDPAVAVGAADGPGAADVGVPPR